jgi:hypothetical protein
MEMKILTLVLLTAILVSASSVFALDFTATTPGEFSKSVNSTSFTLTNTMPDAVNFTFLISPNINDGSGRKVTINSNAVPISLAPGNSTTININTGAVPSDFNLGVFSFPSAITIYAVNASNSSIIANKTLPIVFRSAYCDFGDLQDGSRRLEITAINDETSENEFEWKPLDEVEIEVKARFISNDSDDSIDAIIEIGLYDTQENSFVDIGNEDDLRQSLTIDEGNTEPQLFTITVPVQDIVDSTGRYKLYVRVYEEDNQDRVCRDFKGSEYFKDVTINKQTYEIILNNLEATTPVSCGQEVEVTATAFNTGSHDENKVYVSLYNKDLKLDANSDVFSLDQGDSKKVTFTFNVPPNASEKTYTLQLYTHYKYQKSSDSYKEESDFYDTSIKVEGCTVTTTPSTLITATLETDAIAGQEMTIKATVTNQGTSDASYTFLASGYDDFATLQTIDPPSATIAAGQSKNVLITLKAKDTASGDYTFSIQAVSGGKIKDQPMSVTVVGKQNLLSGQFLESIKSNWIIWVIVLVNIVLIILIIIIAVRISRRD